MHTLILWSIYSIFMDCICLLVLLSSLSKPSAACSFYYSNLDYKSSHAWQLSICIYSMQYVGYVYSKMNIYPHESSAKKLCVVLLRFAKADIL